MYCYVYKNEDGKITAYIQANFPKPPPAIPVTVDEFKRLGFYREPPASQAEPPQEPTPTEAEDTAAMLIDHEYRLTLMELGISEGGEA